MTANRASTIARRNWERIIFFFGVICFFLKRISKIGLDRLFYNSDTIKIRFMPLGELYHWTENE